MTRRPFDTHQGKHGRGGETGRRPVRLLTGNFRRAKWVMEDGDSWNHATRARGARISSSGTFAISPISLRKR
jgi:hypothetical protein